MKNSLKNMVKSALENYEEQYNPADWSALEKALEKKAKISNFTKTALVSSVIVAATAILYYYSSNEAEKNISEKAALQENTLPLTGSNNSAGQISQDAVPAPPVSDSPAAEIPQPGKARVSSLTSIHQLPANPAAFSTNDSKSNETSQIKNSGGELPSPAPGKMLKDDFIPAERNHHPLPTAGFRSDKNSVCANSPVQFNAENSDALFEYHWEFGDGETSNEANPRHTYKTPGSYSVKLQVISIHDQKSDIETARDFIIVNPAPSSDFSWKAQQESQDFMFESNQEDIVEWKWEFGDKQASSEQKPSHVYNKKGNYKASLSLKNNYGCTAFMQKIVPVLNDFNLLAPNAFSPNGDGKNDTWIPVALLSGDYHFTLTILDKNGQVAYKTSSVNNPWDGRHSKTGETAKSGDAFKWMAVVKDKSGAESSYGGIISISESGY